MARDGGRDVMLPLSSACIPPQPWLSRLSVGTRRAMTELLRIVAYVAVDLCVSLSLLHAGPGAWRGPAFARGGSAATTQRTSGACSCRWGPETHAVIAGQSRCHGDRGCRTTSVKRIGLCTAGDHGLASNECTATSSQHAVYVSGAFPRPTTPNARPSSTGASLC